MDLFHTLGTFFIPCENLFCFMLCFHFIPNTSISYPDHGVFLFVYQIGMKILHQVWNKVIWVWNKGYEKKLWRYWARQVAYHTFWNIPKWYENVAAGMKKAHLGMKQMPRVWKVCMMVWNKWQMFWNKHTFEGCQTSAQSSWMALMLQYIHQCSKPLHAFHALEDHTACHDVGVFPVWDPVLLNGFFQDGIGVVWVCFVPFRTVFVWCGFVLYHLYCFQVYSYTTGTTQYLFHNQNGSKIVLCANNCRPQMELFCTIETFFVPLYY